MPDQDLGGVATEEDGCSSVDADADAADAAVERASQAC